MDSNSWINGLFFLSARMVSLSWKHHTLIQALISRGPLKEKEFHSIFTGVIGRNTAATFNAIIISLLVSLAAAGGFLALFFLSLVGIYIGALSVAAFVISTATVSAVVCVLIASGWIGFFYAVWLGASGSLRLAKQSLSLMGGNTFSRHQHKDGEVNIESSS